MRRILLILCIALMPISAMAQPAPAEPAGDGYRWLAIGAGALGGVIVLNVVTGGAALAPLMGGVVVEAAPVVAAGGAAAAAAARQAACRWSAIVSSAIAGGFIGNWIYGE